MSIDTRTTEASGEKLPPDQREVCRSVGSQSHLFIQRWPEDLTNTVSFLNTCTYIQITHFTHEQTHVHTNTHRHTLHTWTNACTHMTHVLHMYYTCTQTYTSHTSHMNKRMYTHAHMYYTCIHTHIKIYTLLGPDWCWCY